MEDFFEIPTEFWDRENSSWQYSPVLWGIIFLGLIISFCVLWWLRCKKCGKKLHVKWIVFVIILTFLVPVFKVNYYSGGCFGEFKVFYKNIYRITVLEKG